MKLSRPVVALLAALIFTAIGVLAWTSLTRLEPAPAVTYRLLDGSSVTTDDLRGKVVLVNFWATSCVTCVKEMPQIAATHEKFRARGFETIAVAMSYDPPAFVSRFAETRQLPFAVAIDGTGDIARGFGDVRLTPTTFLINKRGEIVKRYVGEPDFAALHVLVDRLLAAS
ncbi:MAG: TlpA family protein disulfide reductase [Burkholderiaceae bacterium]|jgi:peroxiredoxin|nr:TlpA family protein disulfide reductase [Burkholderiaceae bacterium]MCU0929157.1 TlpA family protein disulfide reductase [Burkholderiaceae bacterium]